MNKLVIGALTALAATQAAGCIITTDDGGDYATVGATWQINTVQLGANGAVTATPIPSCPPGIDTVALFNVAVDSNGNQIAPCTGPNSVSDTCFVDLFNCSASGSGVSAPLPPTTYQTWIAMTDSTGSSTYARSLSAFLDVRDIDLDFNASITDNGGYFIVDWELEAASNGAPVTCAQASSSFVTADVTIAGGTNYVETNPWPCEDHYGATSVIPEGSYTVAVQALDSSQGQLGLAPEYTNKLITGPNGTTDLGTATIVIDNL